MPPAAVLPVLLLLLLAVPATSFENSPKPDSTLDCDMLKLAYTFALEGQKEKTTNSTAMISVAVALGLTADGQSCTKAVDGAAGVAAGTAAPLATPPLYTNNGVPSDAPQGDGDGDAAVAASVVWVASSGTGSDANPGTEAAPFATVAHAVQATAALPPPRNIMLLGGVHVVESTILLTPANNDTVIASAPGQSASVSGGVQFKTAWSSAGKTSSGATLLKTQCPPQLSEALELFEGAGTGAGAGEVDQAVPLQRYVAARHPNGNPEQDQSNYGGKASGWLPPFNFGAATVVSNSSYPDGTGGIYSVGVGGPANNFEPAVSYWAQPHPSGGGASTYSMVSGMKVKNSTVQLETKNTTAGKV